MTPDALTGVEPGLAFPGWTRIQADLARWMQRCPAFVRNGLAAREELLAGDLPEDKRAWYAAERELFLHALTHQPMAVVA